jgi:hypothetical protein
MDISDRVDNGGFTAVLNIIRSFTETARIELLYIHYAKIGNLYFPDAPGECLN